MCTRRDEYFPADLLLLGTSHAEGMCYIETMNLDGETNLKVRTAPEVTQRAVAKNSGGLGGLHAQVWGKGVFCSCMCVCRVGEGGRACARVHIEMCRPAGYVWLRKGGSCATRPHPLPHWSPIPLQRNQPTTIPCPHPPHTQSHTYTHTHTQMRCEGPNSRLYQFVGNLEIVAEPPQTLPLAASSLLLRGCSLRNTEYVIGAVVYTGVCVCVCVCVLLCVYMRAHAQV